MQKATIYSSFWPIYLQSFLTICLCGYRPKTTKSWGNEVIILNCRAGASGAPPIMRLTSGKSRGYFVKGLLRHHGVYRRPLKFRSHLQSHGKIIYSSWTPELCHSSQQFFPSSLMHNATLQPLHMNTVLRRSTVVPDDL